MNYKILAVFVVLALAFTMPAFADPDQLNISVLDDSSGLKVAGYNFDMLLTNSTGGTSSVSLTSYRDLASQCLYDGDQSTDCWEVRADDDGDPSPPTNYKTIIATQAFDLSNATFLPRIIGSGSGGSINMDVYYDDILVYNDHCSHAGSITAPFTINNSGGILTSKRAGTLRLEFRVSAYSSDYVEAHIREFRLLNNTLNYNYTTTAGSNSDISWSSMPSGNYTYDINIQGDPTQMPEYDSISRHYTGNITGNNSKTLYLPYPAWLSSMLFKAGSTPLKDVTIAVTKYVQGFLTSILQTTSQEDGVAYMWFEPYTFYYFNVSHPSYGSKTFSYMFPSYNTAPQIDMTVGAGNLTIPQLDASVIANVTYDLQPSVGYLLGNSTNVTCNVSAPNNNLLTVNLTGWTRNYTTMTWMPYVSVSDNATNSSLLLTSANITNSTYGFIFTCNVTFSSNYTGSYAIYSSSITRNYVYFGQTFPIVSSDVTVILAIGIMIVVCGFIMRFNINAALLAGICLLILFSMIGWIGWYISAFAIIVTVALMWLRMAV